MESLIKRSLKVKNLLNSSQLRRAVQSHGISYHQYILLKKHAINTKG
jgi:hypothetical protein